MVGCVSGRRRVGGSGVGAVVTMGLAGGVWRFEKRVFPGLSEEDSLSDALDLEVETLRVCGFFRASWNAGTTPFLDARRKEWAAGAACGLNECRAGAAWWARSVKS